MNDTPKLPAELDGLASWLRGMGFYQDEQGYWQEPPEDNGKAHIAYDIPNGDELFERCRRYVQKMPISISGDGGHDAAWMAAQVICRGFALSPSDGWPILCEFSERCDPPWSEKELRHKIEDASANSRLPVGYIVGRPKAIGKASAVVDEEHEPSIVFIGQPAAPGFPVNVFPEPLARFVTQISQSMSCPPDFAAVTMLAIAGAAIGNSRALSIKRKWSEGGRLYVAIVAPPGSAKSPAVDTICKPVFSRQAQKSSEWHNEKKELEKDRDNYEKNKRQAENRYGLAEKPRPVPPEPHLYTTDATTEVLNPILANNPRGLVIVQDEITSWVLKLNQYKGGKGGDRQFFLSAWSGSASKIDRKGNLESGSIQVRNPFIGIVGGIQPEMLAELCDEEGRQDGFVHRILFSYPEPMPDEYWTELDISEKSEETWKEVLDRLYDLEMVETDSGGWRPKYVDLTPSARYLWVRYYNDHQREIKSESFPDALRGPWSKLRAYFARLALIIHYMRWAIYQLTGEIDDTDEPMTENVDAASILRAVALVDYFKAHARRVYGELENTKEDNLALRVYAWLERREGKTCTVRQLIQAHFVKKASQARDLIKDMNDRCMVQVDRKDGGNIVGMRIVKESVA